VKENWWIWAAFTGIVIGQRRAVVNILMKCVLSKAVHVLRSRLITIDWNRRREKTVE
jgi:hypothetical protein